MKRVITLIIVVHVFSLVSAVNFNFDLNDLQFAAKRVNRATRPVCIQPPETPDKNYTVKFPHKDDIAQAKPGEVVPQFTIVVSQCNEGYAIDYDTDASNESPSVCVSSSWQPPVLRCKRMCKTVSHFANYDMTCYEFFGGPKIPCTGMLLEGAIVVARCQQKFHPNIKLKYDYATCQENGDWDRTFFKCVPDCGEVTSSSVSLIADEYPEKRGGAPWNVAIYCSEFGSDEPRFICGGTLINAELVISAAHCFYDEVLHQNLDAKLFHVIVGKATLDYDKLDYATTKMYTLKNIYFPDTPYKGAATNFASDIVILQLSEKVSFSRDVLPACLSWEDGNSFNPGENVLGKLSGFGATSNGSLASVLLSANLPYVSYGECLKKVREDFLASISVDKFCAGSKIGPRARSGDSGGNLFADNKTGLYHLRGVVSNKDLSPRAQSGDSGGGLLFMDNETGLYHLRGVVSNRDLSESSIAVFTDIAQYISWIIKIVEVTQRKPECSCDPRGSVKYGFCDSTSEPCKCKAFVTGKDCNVCKDGFWNLRADNPDGCMACGCSFMGSYSSSCDQISGFCRCKPNVIGEKCDECTDSTKVFGSGGCEDGPKWVKYAHGDSCSNAVVGGYRTPVNETLFIARHQINESLLPGKLVPSKKLAFIPLFFGEHSFSEYEVLCGGLVKWVAASDGVIPRGAVAGGLAYGDVGAETMYVCKSLANDGSVVPGKLHPSKKACFIPNGGKEHPKGQYEVLVQQSQTDCECNSVGSYHSICKGTNTSCRCKPNVIGNNCDRCAPDTYDFGPDGCKAGPKWLKYSNGDRCSNAIVGGNWIPTNETLFIARHQINESLLPGKLVPSQKLAFIPLSMGEHTFPEYEVLCGNSTEWVAASNGIIPRGAVAGGVGYGDIGQETMYVCRAKAKDGSVVPGKLHPSKKVCFIPNEGKEHPIGNYEVLVV